MTANPELLAVARRVVWFKPADETLRNTVFFLNRAMTFGDVRDVVAIRRHYADGVLRDALDNAHPGVFDPPSRSYRHAVLGISPVPAMPTRRLSGVRDRTLLLRRPFCGKSRLGKANRV